MSTIDDFSYIPRIDYEARTRPFRTIDDASARVANAMPDIDPIANAISNLEMRLETMEDVLRRIQSAVREMGPA